MSSQPELDRFIVGWLREGEMRAPLHLGDEIRRAVAATPRRRRRAWLAWPSPWSSVRVATAGFAIVLAGAVLAVMLRPSPTIGPATTSPTAGSSPAIASTPRPTSAPATHTPAPPTPAPTYPTARSWVASGVALDLPEGWFDPPGAEWLALLGALDQLHDPDAGVFNLIFDAGPRTTSDFVFHSAALGRISDIGLGLQAIDPPTPIGDVATDIETRLEAAGYRVSRTRADADGRRVVQLDWERAFNGPVMHFRIFVIRVADAVARVDFCTTGDPTEEQAAGFLDIVRSARVAPGS